MEEANSTNQKTPEFVGAIGLATVTYQVCKSGLSLTVLFLIGIICLVLAAAFSIWGRPLKTYFSKFLVMSFSHWMLMTFFYWTLPQVVQHWIKLPIARSLSLFSGMALFLCLTLRFDANKANAIGLKKVLLFIALLSIAVGSLEYVLG